MFVYVFQLKHMNLKGLINNSTNSFKLYNITCTYNNDNNNKSFISSQWTYTYIHTYFQSLRYNKKSTSTTRNVIHTSLYIIWQKLIRISTANVEKNTILDQTLIMKQSAWVLSRRPQFIPQYIINQRNYSTHWIMKRINNLIVI